MESQKSQVSNQTTLSETSENENTCNQRLTTAEIQAWIVSYLANLLEVDLDDVNPTIPFDRYGLDSSVAVGMTGDLEDWMGQKLDPTLLYDYPTIESLAQHLAK